MSVAREENGVVKIYSEIPEVFELKPNVSYYNLQDASVHYADGFRELVDVTLTGNQKRGGIILINDIYTYEILEETQEDINSKIDRYKNRINSYFSMMYIRALSSSMNKRSTDINYLLGLREEYEDKYNVSKGIVTSGVNYDNTQDAILGEMEDEFTEAYLDTRLPLYGLPIEGTHLDKMYAIIVFKYEYGLNAFNSFNKFIRRFRTKCNSWVDSSEYDKLDSAFAIVDNLPDSLEVADAEILYNEFNAL